MHRYHKPIEPDDEHPAVTRARELANAMNVPIYIIDAPNHRNGVIQADHFHPHHLPDAKIRAVGYPAGWQYAPRRSAA